MTLGAGARLGPYEIEAPLGEGGMGEVYLARDTRLGRNVAVKVLSPSVSADPSRRKRFLREARAISSLSHPHICALYDIGEEGGCEYLVMELLEGETLAERLSRGPLPPEEALRIATEIAGALDRAHRQGVIHRDLKPGNIMLTRSGAKLLDFGLARLAAGGESGSAAPLTVEGEVVGTIEYMAPEQLKGEDADARSDIFSFGAVLYEMLCGVRPFTGHNRASVIGSILFAAPEPLSQRLTGLPPAVDRLVAACLEKSPEERIQTARDLRRQLEWASGGSGEPRLRLRSPSRRLLLRIGAAALLAGGIATAGLVLGRQIGRLPREIRFHVTAPTPGAQVDWPVLSPDGLRIAFVEVTPEGRTRVLVRELSSTEARPVPGSAGGSQPFWSPDSRSLGFFAGQKLLTFALGTEASHPLATAVAPRGASWGAGGVIAYTPHVTTGIFATSALGARQRPVTSLSARDRDVSHRWPEFLPDGKRFVFVIVSRDLARSGLYLGSLDGGHVRKIANVRSRAVPSADGHLLYVSRRRLYRQPFDLERGEVTGPPVAIADGVNADLKMTGASAISSGPPGSMSWLDRPDARSELVLFDRSGTRLARLAGPGYFVNPVLSPDGKKAAVSVIDEETGRNVVNVLDLGSRRLEPIVTDESNSDGPVWSPDGERIGYSSDRSGSYVTYERAPTAVDEDRLMFARRDGYSQLVSWRRGARLFHHIGADGRARLWLWPSGATEPRDLREGAFGQADLSPDGRWLLCNVRTEDAARSEVFVLSVDAPSMRRQVSTGGGRQPRWSADGREVYYVSAVRELVVVPFADGAVGTPVRLFDVPLADIDYANRDYDVAPDGRSFLVNVPVSGGRIAAATVVLRVR